LLFFVFAADFYAALPEKANPHNNKPPLKRPYFTHFRQFELWKVQFVNK